MRRLAAFAIVVAIGSWSCSNKTPTSPDALKSIFTADLRPSSEVPPVTNAESSGNGTATMTFDVTRDAAGNVTSANVTFVVNLRGFPPGTPFNIAHIHEGPSTCACPVVVNTTLAATEAVRAGADGSASFTKTNIAVNPIELANRILSNPGGFYFNVHSTLNPGGVARGILVKVQ